MPSRDQIAKATAQGLQRFLDQTETPRVTVGFDGFVDSIMEVVDQRTGPDDYTAVPTITRFAEKIAAAAGKSSNYELTTKKTKLGGNGPIMANALQTMGMKVTYIGCVGSPTIDPNFQDFADGCEECLSLINPGYTDAVEFSDGKLMLGKYEQVTKISVDDIREVVGTDKMIELFQRSHFVGMVNWAMLIHTSQIWQYLLDEVFPKLTWDRKKRQFVFIDLTDPEKRTRESISDALTILQKMQQFTNVVLGLNYKEAIQVAQVLKLAVTAHTDIGIEELAEAIRNTLDLHSVVVHPRTGAAVSSRTDAGIKTVSFEGPYVAKPKLSTGAGDNFNAGYCLGMLAGLDLEQCLCCGTATSGFYVRNAGSPTIQDLIAFCEDFPYPESEVES